MRTGRVCFIPKARRQASTFVCFPVFDTVEIDSTFYGTPREPQVRQWAQMVGDGFTFCPKAPRVLTHDMRLRDIGEPLAEFVRVMGLLGAKRGPILLQMPPDLPGTNWTISAPCCPPA